MRPSAGHARRLEASTAGQTRIFDNHVRIVDNSYVLLKYPLTALIRVSPSRLFSAPPLFGTADDYTALMPWNIQLQL